MTAEVLFWVFALVAVFSALMTVFARNLVRGALALLLHFLALAALYLLLEAPFLAMVQLIVYAGAIVVFILLTVSVLGLVRADDFDLSVRGFLGGVIALALLVGGLFSVWFATIPGPALFTTGGAAEVGSLLFTRFLIPFEIASVLLLVGFVAAAAYGRKD